MKKVEKYLTSQNWAKQCIKILNGAHPGKFETLTQVMDEMGHLHNKLQKVIVRLKTTNDNEILMALNRALKRHSIKLASLEKYNTKTETTKRLKKPVEVKKAKRTTAASNLVRSIFDRVIQLEDDDRLKLRDMIETYEAL